jgi:hypothetical protein
MAAILKNPLATGASSMIWKRVLPEKQKQTGPQGYGASPSLVNQGSLK